MKTRAGFVSNSSSSSYIVRLPLDFDPSKIDIKKIIDSDEYESWEEAKQEFNITEEMISEAISIFLNRGWLHTGDYKSKHQIDPNVIRYAYTVLNSVAVSRRTIPGGSDLPWGIFLDPIIQKGTQNG